VSYTCTYQDSNLYYTDPIYRRVDLHIEQGAFRIAFTYG